MTDINQSRRVRFVRCPKCDKLLPELPAYTVYLCGGCGAYLKAEKKPTLEELIDRSIILSSENRAAIAAATATATDMAYREGGAEVDRRGRTPERRHNQETNPPVRVSKSPIRSQLNDDSGEGSEFGGFSRPDQWYNKLPKGTEPGERGPGASPVRSVRSGGGFKQSPARDDVVVDEYYATTHKSSPVRSVRGGKSPMRDRFPTGQNTPNKSPARSVRSGMVKSPARSYHSPARSYPTPARSPERGGGRSPLRQVDLQCNKEQMASDEKVDIWIDQQINQKTEQEEASDSDRRASNPPFQQKINSFGDWLDSDNNPVKENPQQQQQQQPEPRGGRGSNSSPNNGQRWRGDEPSIPETEEVFYHNTVETEYESHHQDSESFGARRLVPQGEMRGARVSGGVQRSYRGEDRYVNEDHYERGPPPRRYPQPQPQPQPQPHPDMYYENPRVSYDSSTGSHDSQKELLRKCIELQAHILLMDAGSDPSGRRGPGAVAPPHQDIIRSRSPYQNQGRPHPHNPLHRLHYNSPYEDEDDQHQPHQYHQPQPRRIIRDHRFATPHLPPNNQYPPQPRENQLHHPNCHCPRCNLHAQQHPHHRRSSSSQTEPAVISTTPRDYNSRFSNSSPHMKPISPIITDPDSGSGSTKQRGRRNPTTYLKTKVCHPISGAAPFVVCDHCFELLKLPKKIRAVKKSTLKCGSCSTTLEFDLEVKMMIDPVPIPQHKYMSSDSIGKYSESSVEGSKSLPHQDSLAGGLSSESYNFDKYTFPSSESEPSQLLEELRRRKANNASAAATASAEMKKQQQQQTISPPSSSNPSKEFEQQPPTTTTPPLIHNAAAAARSTTPPLTRNNMVRPPPGSPLRDHMDYSNIIKQGLITDGSVIPRQNSIDSGTSSSSDESHEFAKSGAVPISSNDDLSRGNSIDGASGRRVEQESEEMVSEGGRDFPKLLKGEGFGSSSVSSTMIAMTGKTEVFVNGQPLSQRKVKSAEGLAGPISPGDYWYDSRAGFWGVMGGHCLGIIPPFIQEFGFPMPANCSGGKTSVYVNGRELHESDLDVLAGRRLPRTKDKCYKVDITGRVEIENTGVYVCNLGRLAPSVEKNKCGFGMVSPQAI